MEDMTGRFWDQIFQKLKLRSTMLPGNVTMMLMDIQDKSAQPNQFALCTETGERQTL